MSGWPEARVGAGSVRVTTCILPLVFEPGTSRAPAQLPRSERRVSRSPGGGWMSRTSPLHWREARLARSGAEVGRPAAEVADAGVPPGTHGRGGRRAVEDPFADLDQGEVAGDHGRQRGVERGWQRLEAEGAGQRRGGEQRGGGGGTDGGGGPTAARTSGRLGWLRKNGMRRVRIAKITRVWVARDSTNQPERNSAGPEWNTHSMIAKVPKSNTELSGPKEIMKRRMKAMSQCAGERSCSSSTLSVGMASWLVS